MCKILIVHYSMYGHIYKMAEAVAEGVREGRGARRSSSACRRRCPMRYWG